MFSLSSLWLFNSVGDWCERPTVARRRDALKASSRAQLLFGECSLARARPDVGRNEKSRRKAEARRFLRAQSQLFGGSERAVDCLGRAARHWKSRRRFAARAERLARLAARWRRARRPALPEARRWRRSITIENRRAERVGGSREMPWAEGKSLQIITAREKQTKLGEAGSGRQPNFSANEFAATKSKTCLRRFEAAILPKTCC